MALPAISAIFIDDEKLENEAELIARYIQPHPRHHSRVYASLRDYGHAVSTILRGLQVAHGNVSETAASWEIPEDAVRAVIAFYRRHREYFDAHILIEDDYWYGDDAKVSWPISTSALMFTRLVDLLAARGYSGLIT